MKPTLLHKEQVVQTLGPKNRRLILTNKRILQKSHNTNKSFLHSTFLHNIISVHFTHLNNRKILYLGIGLLVSLPFGIALNLHKTFLISLTLIPSYSIYSSLNTNKIIKMHLTNGHKITKSLFRISTSEAQIIFDLIEQSRYT